MCQNKQNTEIKNKDKKQNKQGFSWLKMPDIVSRVLDNRYVSLLVILILFALFILLLTQIAFVFTPIIEFIQTIILPIIFAGVFYYLSSPLIHFLRKRGLNSYWIAGIVLLVLVLIILWLISFIPNLIDEAKHLIGNWSNIWTQYQSEIENIIFGRWFERSQETLAEYLNNFNLNQFNFNWRELMNTTLSSIGSVFGVITRVIIALVTAPIILFYLIADGEKFRDNFASFIPVKIRNKTMRLLADMNQQISAYVRGQIFVAIAVAVMFAIGYAIIGLNYGTILAVVAGALNVIPYVGSFFGILPSLIVGLVQDPLMVIKVLIVFAIEQTIESRIISPLILGSNLNIHPITIMLLLIAGGDLFGVVGIIIIIPVYAVLKVIFTYIFEWYREVSGLYEEDLIKEQELKEPLVDQDHK
ncbi:AI-2E family transporter [Aerococcus urinae]|uniref:AI-2E family transporter n=1 Tax=Aerococcus mictus TaxID=2976810 RepID=UPI001246A3F3|nr:AI-2E family transporter [Aerococcus mictus]KAA9232388.1 AI-2E family transporter [Aerococcus mictus]